MSDHPNTKRIAGIVVPTDYEPPEPAPALDIAERLDTFRCRVCRNFLSPDAAIVRAHAVATHPDVARPQP